MSTTKKSSLKTKEYRLTDDRSGLMFVLKTGKDKKRRLLVWDEQKELSRPIRHCPSEKSIFMDEQTEYAFVQPILFNHGYLEVDRTKQITQRFLDNHPDNVANGGTWFEEVNDEKEAEDDLIIDELKIDIYNAVRKKANEDGGEYELEAVVAVLENSVQVASEMQIKSLKRESRHAVSVEEQQQMQKQLKDLERKQRKQRAEIWDVEDEIAEKRDALIAALEVRMKQRTEVKELFTVRWSVV